MLLTQNAGKGRGRFKFEFFFFEVTAAQHLFTYSYPTVETLGQCVKYVQS